MLFKNIVFCTNMSKGKIMEEFTNWYSNNYGFRGFATNDLAFVDGQSSSSSSSSSAPPINFPSQSVDLQEPQNHTAMNLTKGDPLFYAFPGLDYFDTEHLESVAEISPDATSQSSQKASNFIDEEKSVVKRIPFETSFKSLVSQLRQILNDHPNDTKPALNAIYSDRFGKKPRYITDTIQAAKKKGLIQQGSETESVILQWINRGPVNPIKDIARVLNSKQAVPIALEILQRNPNASKGELLNIFNELSPRLDWNTVKRFFYKKPPIEGSIEYKLLQEWNNRRSDRHKGHLVLGDMPNGLSRAEEAKSVIVARANILSQIIEIHADQKKAVILGLFAKRIGLTNSSCRAFIKNLETLSKSDLGADWDRVNSAKEMFLSLHITKPYNDKFIEELKRFDRMLHLNPELNKTQITNKMTQNNSRKLAYFNILLAKIRKKVERNEQPIHNGRSINEIHNDYMSRSDSSAVIVPDDHHTMTRKD
jgi:hypothetical protein